MTHRQNCHNSSGIHINCPRANTHPSTYTHSQRTPVAILTSTSTAQVNRSHQNADAYLPCPGFTNAHILSVVALLHHVGHLRQSVCVCVSERVCV